MSSLLCSSLPCLCFLSGKRLWKSMVLQADLSVRHTARRYSACCKKSGTSACHRLFIWVEGQHPCHSSYFIYNDIPPILQVFMSTWCRLWYFQPVFTLPLRDWCCQMYEMRTLRKEMWYGCQGLWKSKQCGMYPLWKMQRCLSYRRYPFRDTSKTGV